MSLECAKSACSENHLNLLYKWIAEDRLTCSFEMAQLVERSRALDLAEFIYRRVDAHYEVGSCLLQAGKSKNLSFFIREFSVRFIEAMSGLSYICIQFDSIYERFVNSTF
jgi:hypothetical protein